MPATFRASGVYNNGGTVRSTVTLTLPPGVPSGALLIAHIALRNGATCTPPTGWTLVRTNGPLSTYTRTGTSGGEAQTHVFAASSSQYHAGVILAYTGVYGIASSAGSSGTASGSPTTFNAPAVTFAAGQEIVSAWAFDHNTAANRTVDTPGAMTERADSNSYAITVAAADQFRASAGSAGPFAASVSGSLSFPAASVSLVLVTNRAPNAPSLTTLASGGAVARTDVNRAAHAHYDPDGDGQAAFRLRYRLVGAGSWTTLADQVTVNQFYDFPASSLALGDYERQVATRDGELWGPFSASGFFTVADRPEGPTFVDPINGQTIPGSDFTATVSFPAWDSAEWQVVVSGTVVDSGSMTSVERSFNVTGLPNSSSATWRVRAVVGGLAGSWTEVITPVSYTTPAVALASVRPISTISASPGTDAILVELLNPVPSGGQPAVGSHRIYRRAGTTGDGVRIVIDHPAGQAYVDRTPASGVDYSYRVESIAANGTASTTPWIGDAVDLVPGTPVEGGDEGDYADASYSTTHYA